MKKFALVLASVALASSTAFAGGIGGGFGGGSDKGLEVDVFGKNSAPIVGVQLNGNVGVGNVGEDLDIGNTSVAVTSDIEIDGPKVDSVTVTGKNSGIVVAVQATGNIGAGNVSGNLNLSNTAAGVASSISIKD